MSSPKKSPGRPKKSPEKKQRAPQPAVGRDELDVTWDQPQTRYPAPERPLDRAEDPERGD